MQDIKWGIMGCGGIAHIFASSLRAAGGGRLLAGASRTPGRADAFAKKEGVERVYTDYESLAEDPDVDAIYVATTHNFHYENTKLCLRNGKHVLCEKPFTVNAVQAAELIGLAREKKVFMMEGLWTRFLPAIRKLQEVLADGAIGEVRTVRADFSIDGLGFAPDHRLPNKALAGGSLLDLGVYPVNFAGIVFGEQPERIQSSAVIGETGVDDRSFYLFDYSGGRRAQLSSSFTHLAPSEGLIAGTKGFIHVPGFHCAHEFHIHRAGVDEPETVRLPYEEGENFRFEIAHAMECIAAGKLESEIMPLAETHAIMQTMDTLRSQWGLAYEGES
jgi:predicted dehydrogenase